MPNYRIQYRRDTAENWETVNPILLDGEVGYEITDQEGVLLQKVGDGVMSADGTIIGTHWNDLPYVSGPIGQPPEHEWDGTSLRFRNPNGIWGDYVNLQGPQGIEGEQGPQGEPGNSNPATKTTLGGIIVGENLKINSDGCLSALPMLLNTEITITESGNWTVPFDGWFEVTCIGGGNGGYIDADGRCFGGNASAPNTKLFHLKKDQVVPYVIGAGGSGIFSNQNRELMFGGATSFLDLVSTPGGDTIIPAAGFNLMTNYSINLVSSLGVGAGRGGASTSGVPNGAYYGAGGFASWTRNVTAQVGNGANGAVIIRCYDPNKELVSDIEQTEGE